jgi:hypothetical protein
MIRQQINLFHLSGKWDVDINLFGDAVDRMKNWGADIISITEMGDDHKGNVLRAAPDFWGTIAPKSNELGENAVHWDKRRLAYVSHKVFPLTNLQVKTETGFLRPPVALLRVILKDRTTGRKIIVCVIHMVSGVEGDLFPLLHDGKIRKDLTCPEAPYRVQVWLSGLRGLKSRMRKIRWFHPQAVVLLVGDTNVNLENLAARQLIEKATGMRLGGYWDNVEGTFEKSGRRIDGLFIDAMDASVGVIEDGRFSGFDHHWLHFPVHVIKR